MASSAPISMISSQGERRHPGALCKEPARGHRGARPCTRYFKLRTSFTRQGSQGESAFRFTGRLRSRKLRPGRYRLVATATDGAGNKSKPRRARFRIVSR